MKKTGEETPGLQLEGVGHGTAVSGPGSLFSDDKVEMQVCREDDVPGTLTVELAVEEGWHVNTNPATFDFLVPTTLIVQAGSRPLEIETYYPEAGTISAEELDEGPISVMPKFSRCAVRTSYLLVSGARCLGVMYYCQRLGFHGHLLENLAAARLYVSIKNSLTVNQVA